MSAVATLRFAIFARRLPKATVEHGNAHVAVFDVPAGVPGLLATAPVDTVEGRPALGISDSAGPSTGNLGSNLLREDVPRRAALQAVNAQIAHVDASVGHDVTVAKYIESLLRGALYVRIQKHAACCLEALAIGVELIEVSARDGASLGAGGEALPLRVDDEQRSIGALEERVGREAEDGATCRLEEVAGVSACL